MSTVDLLRSPTLGTPGPSWLRLIKAEGRKLSTTNLWWWLLLGTFGLFLPTLGINWLQAYGLLGNPPGGPGDVPSDEQAAFDAISTPVFQAANLYTSGQFFGCMFAMLLGILLVTNEFFHQTATATFLTTPHRTAVVMAKAAVSAMYAAGLWLFCTVLAVLAGIGILSLYDQPSFLDDSRVWRAIGFNLLAYVIWGVLGVSFGVLLRSQIGATVTMILVYTLGFLATQLVIVILVENLNWDWLMDAQYALPATASQLMVQSTPIPGQPAWWVGLLVLLGWVVVAGGIGVLINRRRDVS